MLHRQRQHLIYTFMQQSDHVILIKIIIGNISTYSKHISLGKTFP